MAANAAALTGYSLGTRIGQQRVLPDMINKTTPSLSGSRTQESRYSWLLFDADGTLFDYEQAERAALEQALVGIGLSYDAAYHLPAYQEINSALWKGVEKGEIAPAVVKVRRFELLLEAIQVAHSASALSASYVECLANCSELLEGAEAVLGALHQKYKIAILTNGLQVVQRGRLARSAIRHHISDIIISEEIGAAKPAPEYFDKAFARLGNPSKREVLMIGDGWASDIVGAVRYGIDAVWYNPGRQPRPSDLDITGEIAALRELPSFLGWRPGRGLEPMTNDE
jgi:YjjG family noncanonical pyrimidine nucleotidase